MTGVGAVIEGKTGKIVAWSDAIPLRYEYTAGVAGDAFLRGLLGGKILASKCSRCGEVRLPPRTYCLQCYGRAKVEVELLHLGTVASLTQARAGTTFGFVTFQGVEGGLIHKLLPSGRKSTGFGDPVRPVFAPPSARRGGILDLEGFAATPRRRGNR